MTEPGTTKVPDGTGVDLSVLAEHEAPSQRRLAGRNAVPEGRTGPLADLPGVRE
jgi:hypothetical protein